MRLKRTVGTGKIFFCSCGAATAAAGAVWLIVNAAYAAYISGKEPKWSRFYSYTQNSADTVTPWLILIAAMAVCCRYDKMCSANNVSRTGRTAILSLMSAFVPAAFAAADLFAAKLVMQPLYGGFVITRFEEESSYFRYIIEDYAELLGENIPRTLSPYTAGSMLLIFAFTAVYYYCFFLAGCYIIQCFRLGSKKVRIFYAVSTALGIISFYIAYKVGSVNDASLDIILMLITVMIIIVNILTNPVIFLFFFPNYIGGEIEHIMVNFIAMAVFILITAACIEVLGLEQLPSRKSVRKELKRYNARNNRGGGTPNDRQT